VEPSGRGFGTITPAELSALLETGARLRLLDVRERIEYEIARLEGAELVPLAEVPGALDRYDHDEDLVVMCHHGIRSASVCDFLVRSGFARVRNLSGGIDRWSVDVDPSVPRY
jgi:rhodanese-related sulfurtransferase